MLLLFFLSSGLFLGWSLGANDASNIFGTAVGSRMVRFRTAALVASVFVVLGAVISGAGTTRTLSALGSVNEIAGAFIIALAAGFTVFWMTKLQLPVSTSQAIVGAILGWNLFSGTQTDINTLVKIVATWAVSPVIAAIFSMLLYRFFIFLPRITKIHLFRLDAYTRLGLIVVGAFGAYSLGANNIANIMGVFVPVSPFKTFTLGGWLEFSSAQQLFFIGGIAIAVGIITYSRKVMETIGKRVLKLTPQAALMVVLAEGMVMFLFASQGLESWLRAHGLPTIPLVPVSSSQVVVGAVVGIGLAHKGRNIQYRVLGKIASGWITTPIMAAVITFFALFFMQNVFNQKVYHPVDQENAQPISQKFQQTSVDVAPRQVGVILRTKQTIHPVIHVGFLAPMLSVGSYYESENFHSFGNPLVGAITYGKPQRMKTPIQSIYNLRVWNQARTRCAVLPT